MKELFFSIIKPVQYTFRFLDCDAATQIIKYRLEAEDFQPIAYGGTVSVDGEQIFSIIHFWLELDGGAATRYVIDFALPNWFPGKRVPYGIFSLSDHPQVTYAHKQQIVFPVSAFNYQLLIESAHTTMIKKTYGVLQGNTSISNMSYNFKGNYIDLTYQNEPFQIKLYKTEIGIFHKGEFQASSHYEANINAYFPPAGNRVIAKTKTK